MPVVDRSELEQSPLADLHALASELGIEGYRRLRKDDLVDAILTATGGDPGVGAAAGAAGGEATATEPEEAETGDAEGDRRPRRRRSRGGRGRTRDRDPAASDEPEQAQEAGPYVDGEVLDEETGDEEVRTGVLSITEGGSAFMRADPFAPGRDDVYVSAAQIRRCELRPGDEVTGPVRPPRRSERRPSLVRVDTVNGAPAEPPAERPAYAELTAVFASERLETPDELAAVPIGKGSRVAVAGPPGAGATALLRRVISTVRERSPDIETVVVLAGVRPEEVTDWRRDGGALLAGGSFERPPEEHAQAAEMAVERGKRVAERGGDALVVIDSLDALPIASARRVFGAARNTEEAGSLTVIAATGLAAEPQRWATTRIVLEPGGAIAAGSGTLRADLLGG